MAFVEVLFVIGFGLISKAVSTDILLTIADEKLSTEQANAELQGVIDQCVSPCSFVKQNLGNIQILRLSNPSQTLLDELVKNSKLWDIDNDDEISLSGFQTQDQPCNDQNNAPWGIRRTSTRDLPLPTSYTHSDNLGSGVDIYFIDSGVRLTHEEFGGRVVWGTDTSDEPGAETDTHGHGTHVAGTAIGKTFGIAKQARGIAVRVLNSLGIGRVSNVIDGLSWINEHHSNKVNKKSIISISLSTPVSKAFNKVIKEASKGGIIVVTSAGNSNTDSCKSSPSMSSSSISVGCTDDKDNFCHFSNYGKCIDILAPGLGVLSATKDSDTSSGIYSGTSMSAPHVAGVLAKYIGSTDDTITPHKALKWLRKHGVRLTHSEFEGNRVHFGTDVVDDPPVKDDLQGHGTHVTGTILGKNYGLAKGAEGYSVRVLDRDGYGSTSTVIAGIQWVENHHNSKANKKSVANLSLGGTKSTIFNRVIDEAVKAGILFVVAAGNEQADSCSTSPSSARYAISVGCTDQEDVFCSFSNYGDCVNILGPGMSIISASNQGDNLLAISSGTSMSAPHVAGVLAKYLSQVTGPLTYKDANDWLSKEATSNKITKLKAKTPNKLVFMDCAVGGDVKKLSRPAKLQKYYTPRAFYDQM